MFENMLVCLDGSAVAEQILPYAAAEAQCFKGRLVLLHVIHEHLVNFPGIPGASGGPVRTPGGFNQTQKEFDKANDYLEQVAGGLREQGIEVATEVLQGAPGETIISYAEDNEIGLIAIATHGHSGLGRVVYGSVAEHVLRNTGLPILLIRPK